MIVPFQQYMCMCVLPDLQRMQCHNVYLTRKINTLDPQQQLFMRGDLHSFSYCHTGLSDCLAEQPVWCIKFALAHSNLVHMPDWRDGDLRDFTVFDRCPKCRVYIIQSIFALKSLQTRRRFYVLLCCVVRLSHMLPLVKVITW